jgi:hypothetical protein
MTISNKTLRVSRRKATDEEIVSLNSLGLSLRTIAQMLHMHWTTVGKRLTDLSVPLADTRRAFMDNVVDRLTSDEQQWLVDKLGPAFSIQDLFVSLIKEGFLESRSIQKPRPDEAV